MNRDRFEKVAAEWNFNPVIATMFRQFVETVRSTFTLTPDMNLLDIGGGTGLIAFDLAESVSSITIVDNSPAMVATAREHLAQQEIKNVTIVESDIVHADLATNRFDIIYGHMSFHHLESIESVLDRCVVLLADNGTVVIGDLCEEDGSFHGEETVPHNGFDTDHLKQLFLERGFSSVTVETLPPVNRPDHSYERFFLSASK